MHIVWLLHTRCKCACISATHLCIVCHPDLNVVLQAEESTQQAAHAESEAMRDCGAACILTFCPGGEAAVWQEAVGKVLACFPALLQQTRARAQKHAAKPAAGGAYEGVLKDIAPGTAVADLVSGRLQIGSQRDTGQGALDTGAPAHQTADRANAGTSAAARKSARSRQRRVRTHELD